MTSHSTTQYTTYPAQMQPHQAMIKVTIRPWFGYDMIGLELDWPVEPHMAPQTIWPAPIYVARPYLT